MMSLLNSYHYYKYLDIEERGGRQEKPESYQIRFEGVSFSYPGREDKVLYNISLEIKEGETIAIVGENGAGKTTFTKVLLGIFLPGEGEVYFGNKSAKEISQEAYYENASAVFQKYQRYKMTAGENIKISNTDQKDSEKRLKEAIEKAELDLRGRSFSDGENTLLAKEFGGVDLSGGQWQKLAIARGLYRNHSIIVLDEPTAAIDPIEETRVYQKFAEISKGNTSVIVTHRLGSAKIADRILVLDKGRVIEWGTHEELMEKKQKYYSMYQEQAKWYQKDKVKVQVE